MSTFSDDQALIGLVYCRGRQVVVVQDLLFRLLQYLGDSAIGRLNENIDSVVFVEVGSFCNAHTMLIQNVKT